ncbi:MAG: hypothetical protein AAF990_20990 [Bacteroidota bacterium]
MYKTAPETYTMTKIVREVRLLIEMKIKNIENHTNRQINALADESKIDLQSVTVEAGNFPALSELFAYDERLLHIIEQYSTGINRLLSIRTALRPDNVMRVIDLLSNDKFLLCSKSIVDRALLRQAPRAALSVA